MSMDRPCPKCGSTEILGDVPVVSSVDRISSTPVVALAYRRPEARIFKEPVAHRLTARVCAACGLAELYVEDPKGLALAVKEAAAAAGADRPGDEDLR
ncbi:hypothetical protein OJF2_70020 [Aquisphaera giovannonii]|uniref:Uncharacterized protein n=1 Tax=Aquisphaera giovannonii TaxID=406548 RepID=A0A5B9WEM4_9BACT|nr:hypothetical protein [Aquisphaera giovannonii]QEH38401.1 hypothetical protein OJF2_70020 [Aquisphaera giovannonii]